VIRRALLLARDAHSARPADLARLMRREIARAPLAKIDYVEVLDARTLEKPGTGDAGTGDRVRCLVWEDEAD
jgi:pantothenate synthetase